MSCSAKARILRLELGDPPLPDAQLPASISKLDRQPARSSPKLGQLQRELIVLAAQVANHAFAQLVPDI